MTTRKSISALFVSAAWPGAIAFLCAAPLAAQTLSPIVDGHVRRAQTAATNTGSRTCGNPPVPSTPSNCVQSFVYFDKVFVGGLNSFADPLSINGGTIVYWEDSRPIFEFDISSLPATFSAALDFNATSNAFPAPGVTPLQVTVYRSAAADANGVLTNCDFNPAGGGFDGQRWIYNGCSNKVIGSVAGAVSLDVATFPKSYSVDVSTAVAAAKSAGQTRVGFVLGANQGAVPATDTNFDGDELILGDTSTGNGPTLVISSAAPVCELTAGTCAGTSIGQPTSTTVTVRNAGSGILTISGVTEKSGSDSCNAFTIDTTGMKTSLAAGESTTFGVTFNPTAAGTCSVVVDVATNASVCEKEITCTACSTPSSQALVSPKSVSCGPVAAGGTSTATITVANGGCVPLLISGVTESSDPGSAFAVSTAGMSTTVAPGASTAFTVTFTAPTAAGTYSATYAVATNDPASPSINVNFSCVSSSACNGSPRSVNVNPSTGACEVTPVGGSSSTLLTIQNVGGSELTLTDVSEISDPNLAYWLDKSGLQKTLQCGQQTSVRVVFSPPSAGTFTAAIRVTSDDPARPTVDVPFQCSTQAVQVSSTDVASAVLAAGDKGRIVAASAKSPGASGTFWVTDLKIENTSVEDAQLRIFFLEAGRNDSIAPSADFRLAPGGSLAIDDVVGSGLFQKDNLTGAILVVPTTPNSSALIVSSRTYNQAASGTFGQFIGGVSPEARITGGSNQSIPGLLNTADFRANVGAVNTSANPAVVRVVLRRGSDGAAIGNAVLINLEPFGQKQVNRIFDAAGAGVVDNAFAEISLDSGDGAVAYASVIDNRTGDPIFVPATR